MLGFLWVELGGDKVAAGDCSVECLVSIGGDTGHAVSLFSLREVGMDVIEIRFLTHSVPHTEVRILRRDTIPSHVWDLESSFRSKFDVFAFENAETFGCG